jgi:hypothetical protein
MLKVTRAHIAAREINILHTYKTKCSHPPPGGRARYKYNPVTYRGLFVVLH